MSDEDEFSSEKDINEPPEKSTDESLDGESEIESTEGGEQTQANAVNTEEPFESEDEGESSKAEGEGSKEERTHDEVEEKSQNEDVEEPFTDDDEEKDLEESTRESTDEPLYDESETESTKEGKPLQMDATNIEEPYESEDEVKSSSEAKKDRSEEERTEDEVVEKSPDKDEEQPKPRSSDSYRLQNVFARPRHAEPRHPIFSSPFARHISQRAFGPKKPKWYTPLTSAQLYLFKDIMNYVEIGREGLFRLDDFIEALQDFDPSVKHYEVVGTLDAMEQNEFEELDFGKFLFLLAYRDRASSIRNRDHVDELLSTPIVTPRQCLILSAISYYVLIASPEEIERYYIANSRRKATVLHYHMEHSRLGGLTEKQMEKKQKKAMEHLGPLFAITGSPYALPVPFVPSFQKTKLCKELKAIGRKKKTSTTPLLPTESRKRDDPVRYTSKDDQTFNDMHYGRLPMPIMRIPKKMQEEMRKGCTVEHKDYITRKAYEAKDKYLDRLKKATVLYNNRSLDIILKKFFPSEADKEAFIEIYEKYMPLKLEDVKNFSLWVRPSGYQLAHTGLPLYPDKFAFGSKIP